MFGVELPVRSIFETPTISGMSRKILADMLGGGLQRPRQITIRFHVTVTCHFRLHRSGSGSSNNSNPAGAAYHIPLIVRIEGQLDVEALQNTLAELVRRHESLRTTFINVDGEPRQSIAASMKVDLPIVDLSTLPEDEREKQQCDTHLSKRSSRSI